MNKEINTNKVIEYFGTVINVDVDTIKKHGIFSPIDEPNNELNQLENYTELNDYLHTKGNSPRISVDQFFAVLKDKNPNAMFTRAKFAIGKTIIRDKGYPTISDIINFSMSKAKKFVDDYEEIYGEPMYCGSAYVQTPKKSDLGKQLKKLKLGFDSYDGYIHVPLRIMYQSLDLSMLGAKIQKAILEGYGITDLSIGYYSD